MIGIASAATAVAIGYVAEGTSHASASAPAASCCRTTRRSSSPSSSARSRRSFPAASISASAARPAPTAAPGAPCAATPAPPTASRRTCSNCRPCSARSQPGQRIQAVPGAGSQRAALDPRLQHVRRPTRRRPRPALRLRLAFRARRAAAGAARLPRELPPLRPARRAPTPWSAATSSPPTPTPRRGACSPRSSRASPTCSATPAASCRRPIDDIDTYWEPAREGAGLLHARLLLRRLRRHGRAAAWSASSPRPAPTS